MRRRNGGKHDILVHSREGLASLDLDNNTAITDAGLAHLKGLSQLQRLYLIDTAITDAGVAELGQALPRIRIVR